MAIKTRSIGAKKEASAVRMFTDREEPRQAFWRRYEEMTQQGSSIIVYYGTGGVGKSSLLKKLMRELDEKNAAQGGTPYKYVHYDFNDLLGGRDMSIPDILRSMKAKLADYGCKFPLFDTGIFYYSLLLGKNVTAPEVESLIDKNPTLKKIKEKFNTTDEIADGLSSGIDVAASLFDIGSEVADIVPGFKATTKILGFLNRKAVAYIEKHRELDDAHAEIKRQMDERLKEKDPNRIYEYLPVLFAQDINDWTEAQNEKVVFFLDTYEVIGNETSAENVKREQDLWLRNENDDDGKTLGLFMLIPENVLWVIAGRNKLRWDGALGEELEGEHAEDESKASNQHLLKALDYADSDYFLKTAGIVSEELRDGIIRLTEGFPIYLDSCVSTYFNYWNRYNKTPDISEFGQGQDEIVGRMIKYLDAGTQDMLRSLCALKVWTDEMAAGILPNFSPTIYEEQIKKLSFIEETEVSDEDLIATAFRFDRTVYAILSAKYEKESGYLRQDIRDRANEYFGKVLSQAKPDSRKFAYCLEQWADIIARLTDNGEELLGQYEEHLAAIFKSMGWKGYDTKMNVVTVFFDRVKDLENPESVSYAFFEYQLGKAKRNRNEYRVAYDYLKSAYEKFARLLGNEDERSMKALHSLAKMADYAGHAKESAALFGRLVGEYKKKYGTQDEKTVSMMKEMAWKLRDLERYEDALNLHEEILDTVKKVYDAKDKKVLDAMRDVALSLRALGKDEEADQLQKQVLAVLQEELEPYKDQMDRLDESSLAYVSEIVNGITDVIGTLDGNFDDNFDQTLDLYRLLMKAHKLSLGTENATTIDAMIDMAEWLIVRPTNENDMAEMLSIWKDVYEICKTAYGEEDERTLDVMDRWAMWAGYASAPESSPEEIRIRTQLLGIRQRMADECRQYFGEGDEKTIEAMKMVAFCFGSLNRREDELQTQKEIFSIRQSTLGLGDEKTIDAMRDIVSSLEQMEHYEDALKLNEEILRIRRESCGAGDEKSIRAMQDVAYSLNRLERYEDELKIYEDILNLRRQNPDEDGEGIIYAAKDLAYHLHEMGHYEKELPLRQEILTFCHKKYGADSDETRRAMTGAAGTMIALRRYSESVGIWRQIVGICQKNFGTAHSNTAAALSGLSVCVALEIMSRYDEPWKAPLYESATDVAEMMSEREELRMGRSSEAEAVIGLLREIAEALKNAGHSDDAQKCLYQLLELCKAAWGEDDERTKEVAAKYEAAHEG